jgi:glutamine amidotransferase
LIAILDYGSGNLRSAERAFELTGHEVVITSDPKICLTSDGLVVPGVGAYAACMDQLRAVHGEEIIWARVAADKPLLGICVGAQILFESGSEKVGSAGVGLFAGEVSRLSAPVLPNMGWNTVRAGSGSRLLEGLEGASFYFVHSYAAKVTPSDSITSWSEYGEPFIAAIERGPISATQFHPEKSSANGARLIKNWAQTL